MKKAKIIKNGLTVTENAEIADSFFSRFRGLMFRKSVDGDYALHITPCNQVHMFNMRFALDVVYLSESGEVVEIHENVKPNKVCKAVRNAKSVLEMRAKSALEMGIAKGDVLEIKAY